MPTPCAIPDTPAETVVARLRSANAAALAARGGEAAQVPDAQGVAEWIWARDAMPTATTCAGRFWRGCSVPGAAAEAQLRSMAVTGRSACLLDPPHPAVLRGVLDRLKPEQAAIAIVPDEADAAVLFSCGDFADDIAAGRCWVAWGHDWAGQLHAMFQRHPGLAIPTQFVRLASADAARVDPLIDTAQQVFGRVSAERKVRQEDLVTALHARPRGPAVRRVCLVAASQFRPGDDAGAALESAMRGAFASTTSFATDGPVQASNLAILEAVAECDAIVAADACRADVPGLLPLDLPWVAWVTRPRFPAFEPAAQRDGLIVTDPSWVALAARAGWPAERVRVGRWPALAIDLPPAPRGAPAVMFCDVTALDPPADLNDLSSHRLLWEAIADRLRRDPFVAFGRPEAMLDEAMARQNVSPAGFPRARFLDSLIAVGFAVNVARVLFAENIPLALWGAGWEQVADLAGCARGAVKTRPQFERTVAEAGCVVHPGLFPAAHGISRVGHLRPVVACDAGGRGGFVAAVRAALAGRGALLRAEQSVLTADTVLSLFR